MYDPEQDLVNPPIDTADLAPHLFKAMQGNLFQQWVQWALDDKAWNGLCVCLSAPSLSEALS